MKLFIFKFPVSNSNFFFPYRVSNLKCNLSFFNFELVTRTLTNLINYKAKLLTQKKNFCKKYQVNNSKCGVILSSSRIPTPLFNLEIFYLSLKHFLACSIALMSI